MCNSIGNLDHRRGESVALCLGRRIIGWIVLSKPVRPVVMTQFLASIAFLFVIAAANAATFIVTSTNDSGTGSLRDAIAQANAADGPDTIDFSVSGTILLTSGQIPINGPVTINGPGVNNLTIDGNSNSRIFSIFSTDPACPALDGPDYLVSISHLRLTNARRTPNNPGGAIYSEHSLALDSVIVDNNRAGWGGGVLFHLQYSGQSLTIQNSQFLNNTAQPLAATPSHSVGGAVAVAERCATAPTTPSIVTIANSVFSGNRAQPAGPLNGQGGAIAVYSLADVTITDTRIVDNHVVAPNPPVTNQNYRGGGLYGTARSLTIVRTEIADNTVTDITASDVTRGGALGLYNVAAALQTSSDAMAVTIINSTISGNVSSASAGAMWVRGNVALELHNSTVSDNLAAPSRVGGIGLNRGPTEPPSSGNVAPPTLTIVSSILAYNTNNDVAANAGDFDTINATNSLIEKICPSPACEIAVVGSGNLLATEPILGPLAFNDGTTRTQALLAGSPAIDRGSNPMNLSTDQRGAAFARTVGTAVDMGAFEYNPVGTGSTYSRDYVQKAYVAYYGRPGDPPGQTYWATRMDAEGGSLNAIIGAFGYSAEFNGRYGQLTNTQLVTRIYQQALGRDPDQGGLDWYVAELVAGRRTLQTITLDVLNGATTAPDSTVVANKLGVAAFYSAKVAAGCPYGTEQDGVNALSGVTADSITVAIAQVAIGRRCGL
jgi:hypothetical protein